MTQMEAARNGIVTQQVYEEYPTHICDKPCPVE
jgi:hypothetical protein